MDVTISADLVIARLANRLTTAEKQLLAAGHYELVMPTRDLLLRSMRVAATAVVEEVTGCEVVAYLTHNDPDLAVVAFRFASAPSGRSPDADVLGALSDAAPLPASEASTPPSTSSATIDFDTQAITNRIVELMRQRTGTTPSRVETALHFETVVVTLHDCLTTAEHQLVSLGREDLVASGRRVIHQALHTDATVIVEQVTGCKVSGYFSDQQLRPDVAVIGFHLDRSGDAVLD